MREFLLTVVCVCSVSGFKISPVRSVEIITEGAVAETLVFTNQPTTVSPPLVPTSVLSTDSTSLSLSNTEITSSPNTTDDSRNLSNSSLWSISTFVNADDPRPDKIAPSSKGSLGTSSSQIRVPVTTIASPQQSESPTLSNATATSSFDATSTNTEQSNSTTEPLATSVSKTDVASKVSETTTPNESATTKSDPVSYSAITKELSTSTEPPSLNSSKSDTTSTSMKNSEATTPNTFATSTTLQDSKVTTTITSTEQATTHSEPVSTSTTTELSNSSTGSTATSSSKSDITSTNLKKSEATTPIAYNSVAKLTETVATDSLKPKSSASNSLSAIKNDSSSTPNPVSALNTTSSEPASTGSKEPTTESVIVVETTTQDLSFLSLNLLPPKTEYRKNEPDPRYDY